MTNDSSYLLLTEQAALFFVPVMVMQMAGNLWHPYEFLTQTANHLKHNYPYWNRSGEVNGTNSELLVVSTEC